MLFVLPLACTSTPAPPAGTTGTTPIDPTGSEPTVGDTATPPTDTASTGTPTDPGPTDTGSTGTTAPGPAGAGCDPTDPALSPLEQQIIAMPADSWLEIPNTPFLDACRAVEANRPDLSLNEGCAAIINDWSGGAWDPDHRWLLLWGGGHGGYAGNEVYALSLHDGAWSALTEPSVGPFDNSDPLADGNPASRHTYDQLVWLDGQGMFAWGGSVAPSGNSTDTTWRFEPGNGRWTQLASSTVYESVGNFSSGTAYDPVTDRVLVRSYTHFQAYDVAADRWEEIEDFGYEPYWPSLSVYGVRSAAIDPTRRLYFAFGGGDYLVYDIDADALVFDQWVTTGGAPFDNSATAGDHTEQAYATGGGEVLNAEGPGLEYDPPADALVAWLGGGPWVLDLTTRVWSRADGTGAPAEPIERGTYGRWAWMSYLNAFVLVNEVEQNAYVYKHTAGCG
ncbi:MAG: hypothetical protein ABMB14_17250 [Myxococcota bacterium]